MPYDKTITLTIDTNRDLLDDYTAVRRTIRLLNEADLDVTDAAELYSTIQYKIITSILTAYHAHKQLGTRND